MRHMAHSVLKVNVKIPDCATYDSFVNESIGFDPFPGEPLK